MEAWKEYILNILIISITLSIFLQIIPESGKKEVLHILCGVLLTVVILQPFTKIRPDAFLNFQQHVPESPDFLLDKGKEVADAAKKQYITGRCESYILDKAKELGAEIIPVIGVDETLLPVYAEIQGDLEPQIQKMLEQILITDMGITKENQRWTGNPEEEN